MSKTSVAVLRGGPSYGYDLSLKTGAAVLMNLPEGEYNVQDVFVDREGNWNTRGKPTDPGAVLEHTAVVFNALHGTYGEDGQVSKLLDTFGIPYTGSGAFASALAMNKARSNDEVGTFDSDHVYTLNIFVSPNEDSDPVAIARAVFAQFGPPYIVKPLRAGFSIGTIVVNDFTQLAASIHAVKESFGEVIISPYIRGREVTVTVVDGLRDEELYALPPVDILLPNDATFYDYNTKRYGLAEFDVPAHITHSEKNRLQRAAQHVHRTLGLSGYSRSDFILVPPRAGQLTSRIYFLEANTHPDLSPTSSVGVALDAVGIPFEMFLDHVIKNA